VAERPEEIYVRELFDQRFGVRLRKVPEAKTKTPDYELIANESAVAVLEVKRIERTPRTPENGWTRTPEGFDTRVDNSPKRVANLIHEAWKQLSTSPLPKILTFVNDDTLDAMDLEEAFHGRLFYGDESFGYYNTVSAKVAEGRIRDEKGMIDLYVWIDRVWGREPVPVFRFVTDAGYELARHWFNAPQVPR
jgi:hypothetical protein